MSVEIIMESPNPGGGDGVQQQMVKQETPMPEVVEEEPNIEAEIIHDAPVSKQAEFVLQKKPKPPARVVQPQAALETIKGRAEGQTTEGASQPAGIQQIGFAGEVQSARYVMGSASNPKPRYPKLARKRGWQGRVVLRVRVSEDGRPVDVQVMQSSGHGILDRAAMKTLKKWTFQPASKGGVRVASSLNVPIRFDLRNS